MRKSLLYVFAVICTMGFFTACGDDDDSSSSGNWQDLSKTYEGKSVNLVMGEVTIPVDGKSVVIAASSAEKVSVTLNNIIPENKSVVIDAALKEADGTYTFTGESTVGDCVVSVNGTVKGGVAEDKGIGEITKMASIQYCVVDGKFMVTVDKNYVTVLTTLLQQAAGDKLEAAGISIDEIMKLLVDLGGYYGLPLNMKVDGSEATFYADKDLIVPVLTMIAPILKWYCNYFRTQKR